MEVFPLIPNEEKIDKVKGARGFWGEKTKFRLKFSELDSVSKNTLLSFHSQNAFRTFRYFSKEELVGFANEAFLPCKNPKAIVVYSEKGVSFWINEKINSMELESFVKDEYHIDYNLPCQGTISASLEWVGNAKYMEIKTSSISVIVTGQDECLVLSVVTENESRTKSIRINNLSQETISFTLLYNKASVTLCHNNSHITLVTPNIEYSNAELITFQNTYDLIIFENKLPEEIAEVLDKKLISNTSINITDSFVVLQKKTPVKVWGNLGFKTRFLMPNLKVKEELEILLEEV